MRAHKRSRGHAVLPSLCAAGLIAAGVVVALSLPPWLSGPAEMTSMPTASAPPPESRLAAPRTPSASVTTHTATRAAARTPAKAKAIPEATPARSAQSSKAKPRPATRTRAATRSVATRSVRPATRTSSANPSQGGASEIEQEIVRLSNAERSNAGCGDLRPDTRLAEAAGGHSADMALRDYFSHTSPEGLTFVDRARAAGYPAPGGENIAWGQRTAAEVMQDWMNSPGHRRNILNCDFRAIGVGFDSRGNYWTQVFGY
jgi:uncharacterized protein YkwD